MAIVPSLSKTIPDVRPIIKCNSFTWWFNPSACC